MDRTMTQKMQMAGGFALTVLAMPFLGLGMAVVWLFTAFYAFCINCWEATRRFFNATWRSTFDPAYIPNIGLSGHWARSGLAKMAYEAEQQGNWEKAVELRKQNRRLYDINSWHRLGECYENGRGVAKDLGLAYEHYRFAAMHGCKAADEPCDRLREYAFSKSRRRQFYDEIWRSAK
ncbi:MAG: SEL1-like repeat protein [Victivallales bacterium]|nr:SEL1-like repeat protein [Victivallales bacterium]